MFLMFCFNAGYKGGAGAKIRRKCGAGAKATTEDDYAKAYSHVKINGRELVTVHIESFATASSIIYSLKCRIAFPTV